MGDREAVPDLAAATQHLSKASSALKDPAARAKLLDALAAALDGKRDEIIRTCADETALLPEELAPEFARMTGTLRMFAELVREGSWVRAAIDTPSDSAIGPNHDVRKMLIPLGPVAVFGASNFPLAYGVCGGDTASALAAGCPVVVKEHPAHPRTGRLIALIANGAARGCGGADGIVNYIRGRDGNDIALGKALVEHTEIRAVGFTGSTKGGISVLNAGSCRCYGETYPDPIPVYAEMGSCNVIFVLRYAFERRHEQIADEVAASLLMRVGQQCTAPGILMIAGYDNADWMYAALAERVARAPLRRMLSPRIAANYYRRLEEVIESGIIERHTPLPTLDQRVDFLGVPVLLGTQAVKMERTRTIWEEIFGPGLVVAGCGSLASGYHFGGDGRLAVTLYAEPEDHVEDDSWMFDDAFIGTAPEIAKTVAEKTGRLIFNGPPTGVRVAHGMVHGGPFPATNRPDTTAVGPLAIERWCRPVCFQNCPDALLPPELQNANPRGIWRTVNGQLTRDPVA